MSRYVAATVKLYFSRLSLLSSGYWSVIGVYWKVYSSSQYKGMVLERRSFTSCNYCSRNINLVSVILVSKSEIEFVPIICKV